MKRNLKYLTGPFLLLIIILSCGKQQTDFRNFLGGHEKIYTGSVGDVISMSGSLKTLLKWKSSTDPSIVKYAIFYNKKDSVIVDVKAKTDSVSALIENLQEFVYSFTIYSYDAAGNKSVPRVVNNVKVYGPIYQASLLNRPYNADVPYVVKPNGDVELNFNAPDTINIDTKVKYTSTSGTVKEAELAPGDSILTLSDYKPNTEVTYVSSYKPERNAIDVFTVGTASVFPQILYYTVICDKSLFRENTLPNDAGLYDSNSTRVSRLWDGSVGPQSYPNIFHSDGSQPIPHTITFDMGKVYNNLAIIEETGRDCCNNPDDFEVWGIADITNAATTLRSNDPKWKDEAIAKGWVLLKEVIRTDDGKNAFRANLIRNPPPVRYIRIRIKHVTGNDGYFSNMSELTFWNNQ
jgi:hypothetical protein